MGLLFRRGDESAPRGHALVVFREQDDDSRLRATYLIVAPIEMDFAKYVPPMFAAQVAEIAPAGPAAIPLPPVPEPVESMGWITRLADARHDDLIDGGTLNAASPQAMLAATTEIAGTYTSLWLDFASRLSAEVAASDVAVEESAEAAEATDVDALLMSIMSDSEKVARLARLAGTLRYAAELGERGLLEETAGGMERIGRLLNKSYHFDQLLEAGRRPDQVGGQLLQLYVERAFKLAADAYEEVERLDDEIRELSGPARPTGSG